MTARPLVRDRHPGGGDRNRDLQLIHIAKKALGMDDDAYRAIILGISNQRARSSADLSGPERKKLLDHLKACGFRVVKPAPKNLFPDTPEWRLIWSLWQQLADAKKVNDRRAGALVAFVKHQVGVDAVAWAEPEKIIQPLRKWLAR